MMKIQQHCYAINQAMSVSWYSPLAQPLAQEHAYEGVKSPKATLYLCIFAAWIATLIWFQPRLWSLLHLAYNAPSWIALITFILFIDFAWLYGIYNVGVVLFAVVYRLCRNVSQHSIPGTFSGGFPPVAILYTTCNDFVEQSVRSCIHQDYPNFKVYILDDSTDEGCRQQIDAFAGRHPETVIVVRRPDRKGFKAGNMNHGLSNVVSEPYFAIADADEILPPDFLTKLVPYLEADPHCGFVQANHRANPGAKSPLAQALGVGIDIHWKWYQPLRNAYGFVMFLGHGALLRRDVWEKIGGFPDIVSEDLGFAIHARELGYRGKFVEEVICYEDFPDTVRAFRIRHMKWTRGTTEFLSKRFRWLLQAKNITWPEKLDILFPTLNLPLTLIYFLFMVNANLALPWFFGHVQDVTLMVGGQEFTLPVMILDKGFEAIYSVDFFLITLLTFFGPVLCFILALAEQPIRLFKFLSHSTALYAALGPLSSIGVLAYLISGKAIFLVTGDKNQMNQSCEVEKKPLWQTIREHYNAFIQKSHPDSRIVQWIEILTGLLFAWVCIYMFQISFMGLCLAFVLLPVMHYLGWNNRYVKRLVYLPFLLIVLGVVLAGLSLFGMQAVFFGYGFHF